MPYGSLPGRSIYFWSDELRASVDKAYALVCSELRTFLSIPDEGDFRGDRIERNFERFVMRRP